MEEVSWKRLHPASIWVNVLPLTWRYLAAFWPLLVIALFGGGMGLGLVDLFLMLGTVGAGAASSLVHYATLRYRVEGGKLEIRKGLPHREFRSIDPERIQNLERVRNPIHKLAGLVEVRLETAGDVKTEGLLSALSEEAASELIGAIDLARRQMVPEEEPQENELLTQGVLELVGYGLSSGKPGLVLVMVLGAIEFGEMLAMRDHQAPSWVSDALQVRADDPLQFAAALLGLVLLAVVISWMGSAFFSLVRHFSFRLVRTQEGLYTEEGLITRRHVEIPTRKVQVVMAFEPLMRRLMGYGTVYVETAGLGVVVGGARRAEAVIPMVERERLGAVCHQVLPLVDENPWSTPLLPPHRNALYRAVVAWLIQWVPMVGLLVFFYWPWGLLGLCILPVGILGAWLDFRFQGWRVEGEAVVSRRGFWKRRTWLMARDKVQSVHLEQGPLMRRYGLGRLHILVADGEVFLPDLAWDRANDLLERLRPLSAEEE